MCFDIWRLFYEFYCSAPAAWIKVLSFGVCFKSIASFCHPQYLLRTSPRSTWCAWNSRIWHFHLNNTLWPQRNVWNLVFATSRPESMKLTCQFRRFLARTLRPVHTSLGKSVSVSLRRTGLTLEVIWPSPATLASTRVPGLPIRDCARSSNNLVPRGAKLSAIDVTLKVFFQRLYWFQDWAHLSPESTVRVLPHPHCSLNNYFSISVQFFSDVTPHFLSAHDSPSNLAKSRGWAQTNFVELWSVSRPRLAENQARDGHRDMGDVST